ncbi:MAG: nucleotidyltransferase domain-containing protein [archaeon YNP-LCB-024-027]|nr:nucleotidyltransferase domain-containing protein [Candidatus Culexarchaeum yellowstonense]
MDIIKIISERVSVIAEKYGIVYAILFGSIVEGRFIKGESDIDLAVKVDKLDKSELFNFLKNFIRDMEMDNLDVVVINFAPFSLNYEILMRGKVIFCKDELFEDKLKIIKLYDDWLHISKAFQERELRKVME